MELADLHQYSSSGKHYRIKDAKGLRMTMEEFKLLAYYSTEKMAGQWAVGDETHVFDHVFAIKYHSGIKLRKYYVRNGEICPGVPNLFFTNDQWSTLIPLLSTIHEYCFGHVDIQPCFLNRKTHYDEKDDTFIGCQLCVPPFVP